VFVNVGKSGSKLRELEVSLFSDDPITGGPAGWGWSWIIIRAGEAFDQGTACGWSTCHGLTGLLCSPLGELNRFQRFWRVSDIRAQIVSLFPKSRKLDWLDLYHFISKNQNMMIATYLCVCPTWYHKTEDILLVSWLKLVDPNAGAKHDIEWPLRLVWVHDTSILNHSHMSCKVKNKDK